MYVYLQLNGRFEKRDDADAKRTNNDEEKGDKRTEDISNRWKNRKNPFFERKTPEVEKRDEEVGQEKKWWSVLSLNTKDVVSRTTRFRGRRRQEAEMSNS